jgi:hypothetical protein
MDNITISFWKGNLVSAVKSPASLTSQEKIQLLEEMGIDVDRWYTKIYYGNHIGKDLRQYIEERSAEQGEEMK